MKMTKGRSRGKRTYVYQILFPNMKKYIGITYDFEKRQKSHKQGRKKNAIGYAMKKYKGQTIHSIIAICQNRGLAEELEIFYIKKLNTTLGNNGYNSSHGGEKGGQLLDEVKDKIAIKQGRKKFIGYRIDGTIVGAWINAKAAQRDLGIKSSTVSSVLNKKKRQVEGYYFLHEDEPFTPVRDKITRKGTLHTEEVRNKIAIIGGGKPFYAFKNNEKFGPFTSQKVAAEQLGSHQQNIGKVLLGLRQEADGYIFRYVENDDRVVRKTCNMDFNVYKDGVFVKNFSNVPEAAIELGVPNANINKVLQNKRRSAGGYTFVYSNPIAIELIKPKNKKKQRAFACYKNNEYFGKYYSVEEASKALKIKEGGIRRCLSGSRKTNYGYSFKYI